ncbi:tRNA (adenosine(37)-N6)-threonylcarbamoyltransferase complex dimerization subunit type 1 TsaB [Garciella nitratireducens]|uniref:tRNA (adenosine(37)-N6)-threonylcarbamoyltransferase complex dimerization subunit type 1 TsaB n=1 Tax=Garciella nitratireducens TaxID=218205 RepID=UPI000DEA9B89|nr:tRNA (adenosine(37)-N6)-threonylcarbamoyltransferase complex dimerization subunit type 1 TsaB [Garciella nitratireducens]RBP44120.1 tRNA threonylcarbamoyladenosine biosynthesis protein TsaB [Garciella nitratireducens]
MKLLALDSSSIVATVALMEEDKLIGEIILNHRKNHSEKLVPIIHRLLEEVEMDIQEIDAFGVCIGPGSFTGIRIGVSTAKALAQVGNKPLIGISTLEGLAFNLPYCKGIICPILDAQRNQIYTGLYKWEGNQMYSIEKEQAIGVEEWIEKIQDRNEHIHFVGDGVEKFISFFQERLKDRVSVTPSTVKMPRASSIGALAMDKIQRGKITEYKEIVPNYIRKSQAEQNLKIKGEGNARRV